MVGWHQASSSSDCKEVESKRDTIYKAARKMSKNPETSIGAGKPRWVKY